MKNKKAHACRIVDFLDNNIRLFSILIVSCIFFSSCAGFQEALQEAQEVREKRLAAKREQYATLPAAKGETKVDDEAEKAESDNYTLMLADDLKGNEDFDDPAERKAFLENELPYMESLYIELHDRFGFQPEYKIGVTIYQNYQNNRQADTHKQYVQSNTGKTLKSIKINFPLSMYKDPGVRAHELTHAFTSAYFLPVWFDEGIAVLIQTEFAQRRSHPKFDSLQKDLRRNLDGINSLEDWETGGSPELILWRYRYAHTVIAELQKLHGKDFYIKAFQLMDADQLYNKLSGRMPTSFLVYYLSQAAGADLVPFFKNLHFNVRKITKEEILQNIGQTN